MNRVALCLLAFAGMVQAQGEGRTCSLSHLVAAPGQTVTLKCREQGNSIKFYQVSWVVEPTPGSNLIHVIKVRATADPIGLPMVGVSELKAEFNDLPVGAYRVKFAADSDFQVDFSFMSDFEVAASLRVHDAGPDGVRKPPAPAARSLARWRIDGRKAPEGRP